MATQFSFILDASVIIKWVKKSEEPDREIALQIYNKYLAGEVNIAIPQLVYYEIGNVLSSKTHLDVETAAGLLNDYLKLNLDTFPLIPQLVELSMHYSINYHITFYDAVYIALAEQLEYDFVTSDRKLKNSLQYNPRVYLLSQLKL